MRYLVSIEPDYDRINEIDMSGDVMSLLDWLQETFEAEVMYLEAGRRLPDRNRWRDQIREV